MSTVPTVVLFPSLGVWEDLVWVKREAGDMGERTWGDDSQKAPWISPLLRLDDGRLAGPGRVAPAILDV